MPVVIGVRLNSYEITGMLGKGGMGEVYRARDWKLNRDVAIKLLPEEFVSDPDRVARFQREAEALASLNHPNIATIHDVQEAAGSRFLVMELVEGETLDQHIRRGPISVDETLHIAKQIAEALAAAHDKNLIHRDLKPGNIMITPEGKVKILDFGLAKVFEETASTNLSNSPTLPDRTIGGVILGTPAYLSPEQARGRVVDRRTDVWAFGSVLYEMLTGRQIFGGETVSDIIARIIKDEPDWTLLPPQTSQSLRQLLRRCLQKDPRLRMRDFVDIAIEVEDARVLGTDFMAPRRRPYAPWVTAVLALIIAAAAMFANIYQSPRPSLSSPTRLSVVLPEGVRVQQLSINPPAISPDGRFIVFGAERAGEPFRLWIRALSQQDAHPIAGTERGFGQFWSPDGKSIAFFASDKLKRVSIEGGLPQVICSAEGTEGTGGTWNRDGVILFSARPGGVQRVAVSGGTPEVVTEPDTAHGEAHLWPYFLPDGKHFLYSATTNESAERVIFVGSLGSHDRKRVLTARSHVVYVEPGYLIFIRHGTLLAQEFDATTLALKGEPNSIDADVNNYYSAFNASKETLAYTAFTRSVALSWVDRSGKAIGDAMLRGKYGWPTLSPNDGRIIVDLTDPDSGVRSLWLFDNRGAKTRLTPGLTDDSDAVWSPDGKRIVFANSAGRAMHEMALDDPGSSQPLLDFGDHMDQAYPSDWSADNRYIAYTGYTSNAHTWLLALAGHAQIPFATTQGADAHQARFSPDSRWIAFASDESGRPEVYVRAVPPRQYTRVISTGGGSQPMWRADGRELFYLAEDNTLMSVPIDLRDTTVEPRQPNPLFKLQIKESTFYAVRNQYVTAPDGSRFLVSGSSESSGALHVVVNWSAALRK